MSDDDIYGSDPHTMHRREDGDTSVDAAHRVDSKRWEKRVHEFIVAAGPHGACSREIIRAMGAIHQNSITPRFAPLRLKKLIVDSGQRREKCKVWVDIEYDDPSRLNEVPKKSRLRLMTEEVSRLRALLRKHRIDPDQLDLL